MTGVQTCALPILALAIAFGTYWSIPPEFAGFKGYEKLLGRTVALPELLMRSVAGQISEDALKTYGGEAQVKKTLADAKEIAELFGIDFAALEAKALEEIPEPKETPKSPKAAKASCMCSTTTKAGRSTNCCRRTRSIPRPAFPAGSARRDCSVRSPP